MNVKSSCDFCHSLNYLPSSARVQMKLPPNAWVFELKGNRVTSARESHLADSHLGSFCFGMLTSKTSAKKYNSIPPLRASRAFQFSHQLQKKQNTETPNVPAAAGFPAQSCTEPTWCSSLDREAAATTTAPPSATSHPALSGCSAAVQPAD